MNRWSYLVVGVLCIAATNAFGQVPPQIVYTGELHADGAPVTDTISAVFSLFDADTGGSLLWTERIEPLAVTDGHFTATLGAAVGKELLPAHFLPAGVWLEVTVNGVVLTPRSEVRSVPYAVRAGEADSLPGLLPGEIVTTGELTTLQAQVDALSATGSSAFVDWANVENAPAGLSDGDDDTLILLTCNSGDMVFWDGAQFDCQAMPAGFDAADAVAALLPHTSDANAHHARYTDGEAVTALVA